MTEHWKSRLISCFSRLRVQINCDSNEVSAFRWNFRILCEMENMFLGSANDKGAQSG